MGEVTLFVDTTLQGVFAALVSLQSKEELWRGSFPEVNGSAAALTPLVASGLKHIHAEASSVRELVVSEGPGSFTGIKVGLAWGMGFAHDGCTLFGVSSFELAQAYLGFGPLFTSCTKTHGFLSYGDGNTSKTQLINVDMMDGLSKPDLSGAVLGGEWPLLEAWFQRHHGALRTIEKTHLANSALEAMIDAYQRDLLSPTARVLPRYLRASTAEENIGR